MMSLSILPIHKTTLKRLKKVLGNLREHQLFAKALKGKILKTSVESFGQQICKGGRTLIDAKLKAIRDWAIPKDVEGVRSFLGFEDYY